MWRQRGKKQKEREKPEAAIASHKPPKKGHEKTSSTQQVPETARSQLEGPSFKVTPATALGSNPPKRPSAGGSEPKLTANSSVVMVSPYRISNDESSPRVTFSKDLLMQMDHNKHHLEIDLLRPEGKADVFPPQDLSPLCLYRELRTLKITGMMQSYQWYIWLAVWLNPQLTDLTLEMAGEAEPLDMDIIAEAQKYAQCKPTMQEVAQGKDKAEILKKFHIVHLRLTNFVIYDAPFKWFSDLTLQKVELHKCQDANFEIPMVMERSFNITVTM